MGRAWSRRGRYRRAAGALPRGPATGTSASATRGGLGTPAGSPNVWEADWSSSSSSCSSVEDLRGVAEPAPPPGGAEQSRMHAVLEAMADAVAVQSLVPAGTRPAIAPSLPRCGSPPPRAVERQ